LVQKQKGSL